MLGDMTKIVVEDRLRQGVGLTHEALSHCPAKGFAFIYIVAFANQQVPPCLGGRVDVRELAVVGRVESRRSLLVREDSDPVAQEMKAHPVRSSRRWSGPLRVAPPL